LSTALHIASDENHQDVVFLLLDRGADIEVKNKVGTSIYADARLIMILMTEMIERRLSEVLSLHFYT
jgi:ankyrin repeat protein